MSRIVNTFEFSIKKPFKDHNSYNFYPPEVDPTHPPIIISQIKICFATVGKKSDPMSCVPKPVVVITETT